MRRLLPVLTLILTALLAAPISQAQQRPAPTLDAETRAAAPAERPERPVYYRYDEATGGLVLNEAGRAASAAFRADLPQTTRRAPAVRPTPLTDAERQALRKEQARALAADPVRAARLKQRMADAVAQNPRAEVATFSGNTTAAPTWQRPLNVGDGSSGSCLLSGAGTDVPYEANSFTVPATASYDVYASYDVASNYDGYLTLYEGSFDPSDPCLNLIARDDDFADASQSLIESAALTAGTTYLAVVTGFDNDDFGVYEGGVFDAGTVPVTFTVTVAFDDEFSPDENPGDGLCDDLDGTCGLRTAIEEANATAAVRPVFIDFAIDDGPAGAEIAPGVWRITVDFAPPPPFTGGGPSPIPLPSINKSDVTIDGLTQPGASCGDLVTGPKHDLRVVLDGSQLAFGEGLFGQGGGLTVRGLVVQNFPGFGIEARNDGDNLVECNYVGTDYTGETAAGNFSGVFASGTAQNNVVSGNANIGILPDPFEDGMVVQRNLVGSDADGNQPLGNGGHGIHISGDDAVVNTNLSSDNGGVGIFLGVDPGEHGAFPTGAMLTGNTIGLNRVRTAALGNSFEGILLEDNSSPFGGPVRNDIGLPNDGNFVAGNGRDGIRLDGGIVISNRIRGNTVGLTRLGDALPNGDEGIRVVAADTTTIGGLAMGEGNVIAGNGGNGIQLAFDVGTTVEGNIIGLNANGDIRPNGPVGDGLNNSGIELQNSQVVEIRGNTISGNNGSGIRFEPVTRADFGEDVSRTASDAGSRGGFSSSAIIENNRIGTTADGSAIRPNVESGLVLGSSAGFATVTDNTISGNTDTGVFLFGGVEGVTLENNFIGTNASGDALGNGLPGGDGRAGIFCQNASNVRIGQNFQPNTIRFNGTDGIFLSGPCSDIAIVGNIIDSNGGLAIDLAPDGPNPNDAGDGDTGANDRLNFPVITSAENDGSNSIISWTFNAEPFTTYELLFCRNDAPDASGFGECQTPNALSTRTTDGDGNVSGTQSLGAGAYPVGSFVTVNATAFAGPLPQGYIKTSEFAQSVEVEDTSTPDAVTIEATPTSPLTVPRGGQVSFSYTITNGTANPATGQSWFSAALGGNTLAQGVITNGTLPAGQQVTIPYVQNVPNNAPIANYDFCLRIGLFPSPFIDEACFVVTVTPAPPVAGSGEDWSVEDVGDWAPEPIESASGEPESESAQAASSEALPTEALLTGAYPNPFSRSATVGFALPVAQRVKLTVYDMLGREVAVLVDGGLEAGRHTATLDGSTLPSGVYLVRLVAGEQTRTGQITLLR